MMVFAADQRRRGGRPEGTPNKAPEGPDTALSVNARKLLTLRRQHHLTQRQIAELLLVKTDTVSKWERDAINVPDRVVKLAERLLAKKKKTS
jgi:DNA-binding transcriptional regulator YiaG